jgi:G3E family GTPase
VITLVPIGGFLGAGKTTAMLAAARWLQAAGRSVAVVTNDQGDNLVDTALGREAALPVGEVAGGCLCCRFDDLVSVVTELARRHRVDTVLAEAVGSCTDLAATVVRPLERYHGDRVRVAPLTILVDPVRYRTLGRGRRRPGWFPYRAADVVDPLAYLFRKQLEEAEVIALSKADLLAEPEFAELSSCLAGGFPDARLLAVSAWSGRGLDELLASWLTDVRRPARALDLDYDVYADAEARLAWLNAVLEVRPGAEPLDAAAWAESCVGALHGALAPIGALIGHLKARPATAPAQADPVEAARVRVLVNARAEVAPVELEQALVEAAAATDRRLGTMASVVRIESFRPARPEPIHRLGITEGRCVIPPSMGGP